MKKEEILSDEIIEDMTNHYYDLIRMQKCMNLFLYCMEGNIYNESSIEIYYFGDLIADNIKNSKLKFQNIEKKLGIYE